MNSNTDRARKDVCDERPGQLYAMDDLESQCRMDGDGAGETTGQCHNALRDVTDATPQQEVSPTMILHRTSVLLLTTN